MRMSDFFHEDEGWSTKMPPKGVRLIVRVPQRPHGYEYEVAILQMHKSKVFGDSMQYCRENGSVIEDVQDWRIAPEDLDLGDQVVS